MPFKDLPEGINRPALKTLHINKCPVVVPESTLNADAAKRLQIDKALHYKHLEQLNAAGDLTAKINAIFTKPDYEANDDPDAGLYSGGFFSANDKRKMELVRTADADALRVMPIPFEDARLPEMLFRYRARNWPESLTANEQEQWQQYREQRLTDEGNSKVLTFRKFFEAIETCRKGELTVEQRLALDRLDEYGHEIKSSF